MPRHVIAVAIGLVTALSAMSGRAVAQAPAAEKSQPVLARHAVKAKARTASPFAEAGVMHTDDWFSLGPPKEAEIEKEAPGVKIKVHDPQEDDITVYGVRHRRDFDGATPAPNLTSPQALDAAQPYVPNMGDSCTYKYGCFDMSQTPLTSAASSLFGGD